MTANNRKGEKSMKFVNMTRNYLYSSFIGKLGPGAISSEGGKNRRKLEEALDEIVRACGGRLGIILNEREASLLDKLMSLDEKGRSFNQDDIPAEIRNDPSGLKRVSKRDMEAQMAEIEKRSEMNRKSAMIESEINGETSSRKPVGPAFMEGSEVGPSDLKSGFEKIMEENARIAAGEKPKMDVNEALDPIGAHAMKTGESHGPSEAGAVNDKDEVNESPSMKIRRAKDVKGDVAKNADADEPVAKAQDERNKMDRQAAEIAKGLSVLSAIDNPPAKGKRGRRKANKEA